MNPRNAHAEFERVFCHIVIVLRPPPSYFSTKTHALVDKRTQNKPVGELFSQTTNFNKIFEKEMTTTVLTAITLFS